jgi:hypothetical protein
VNLGWVRRIRTLAPDAVFGPPAGEPVLAAAEAALGHRLPPDLRGLLLEGDGVRLATGAASIQEVLVWPLARIVVRNLAARPAGGEPLLSFADAGDGDRFALLLRPRRRDVFVRDSDDDYRMWAATNLATFLEGRLSRPRPAHP